MVSKMEYYLSINCRVVRKTGLSDQTLVSVLHPSPRRILVLKSPSIWSSGVTISHKSDNNSPANGTSGHSILFVKNISRTRILVPAPTNGVFALTIFLQNPHLTASCGFTQSNGCTSSFVTVSLIILPRAISN